jgi:hypothetical protein
MVFSVTKEVAVVRPRVLFPPPPPTLAVPLLAGPPLAVPLPVTAEEVEAEDALDWPPEVLRPPPPPPPVVPVPLVSPLLGEGGGRPLRPLLLLPLALPLPELLLSLNKSVDRAVRTTS